jgi:hypothetical protein
VGEMRYAYKIWTRKPVGMRNFVGGLSVNVRIILKWIVKN